jgi:hypothetical protein
MLSRVEDFLGLTLDHAARLTGEYWTGYWAPLADSGMIVHKVPTFVHYVVYGEPPKKGEHYDGCLYRRP